MAPAPPQHDLTQSDLRALKRAEQREKTRQRMARHRAQLKTLSPEAQAEAHERARLARATYRANEYAHNHGVEAYEAKLERQRLKTLENEQRRRRAVRPRAPKPKSPSRKPRSACSGPQNHEPFAEAVLHNNSLE
ncbi:hypothetical protein C8F04DRAFT_1191702 [Mycena alexandri]|uniref:Uncharacterized protein n=1 Tax=Mycena alexandri TaxID=1745969 RepID=A0AAD6SGQ1_9AGAR|nr:hypothetical protein C8F04DRAFT_1191702 [Mycena alexandri]